MTSVTLPIASSLAVIGERGDRFIDAVTDGAPNAARWFSRKTAQLVEVVRHANFNNRLI
jgi:hypothetical protein